MRLRGKFVLNYREELYLNKLYGGRYSKEFKGIISREDEFYWICRLQRLYLHNSSNLQYGNATDPLKRPSFQAKKRHVVAEPINESPKAWDRGTLSSPFDNDTDGKMSDIQRQLLQFICRCVLSEICVV